MRCRNHGNAYNSAVKITPFVISSDVEQLVRPIYVSHNWKHCWCKHNTSIVYTPNKTWRYVLNSFSIARFHSDERCSRSIATRINIKYAFFHVNYPDYQSNRLLWLAWYFVFFCCNHKPGLISSRSYTRTVILTQWLGVTANVMVMWVRMKDGVSDDVQWRWLQADCHNFIRVLLLHDNLVFACGTNSYAPRCSWRKVSKPTYSTSLIIHHCRHQHLAAAADCTSATCIYLFWSSLTVSCHAWSIRYERWDAVATLRTVFRN